MENKLKFIKYHLPCPSCKSSDALSLNEDGSAKCFSCDKFFPKYNANETYTEPTKGEIMNTLSTENSIFAHLTDRSISKQTAEKY